MAASYRQSNDHYEFHNPNPKNHVREGDCVVRALAHGLNKGWAEIFESLCEIGRRECRMPNSDECYQSYLQEHGYKKQGQPRKEDGKKYTLLDFCKAYSKGWYIVRIARHLTCVRDGKVIDTWDCSNKCVGNFWQTK